MLFDVARGVGGVSVTVDGDVLFDGHGLGGGTQVGVGCQYGVGSLWEYRFEVRDGSVWDGFEFGVRDAFFYVGVAVEDDLDAFALEEELDVGERRAAVGDEVCRSR